MPVDHYENFPVASFLVPKHLRHATEAIYAFARSADDIADEGDASNETRIASLDAYLRALDAIEADQAPHSPLFARLQAVIKAHRLPLAPFRNLISAFKQDVVKKNYADFADLRDYCRRSADPVGRIMLHLYDHADQQSLEQSDAICTALQLINFWQDVAIDWQKERVYLPQADMEEHGVTVAHIANGQLDAAWRSLMAFEVARARTMMLFGAPLALTLPGRLGWELRFVVLGGLRILERIERVNYDVFHHRPSLGKRDWIVLLWRAVRMRARLSSAKTM